MIIEQQKSKFKQWNCGSCRKLLGLIYNNGTLAIKYKDLLLWATGEVKTICRYCQVENVYKSDNKIDSLV